MEAALDELDQLLEDARERALTGPECEHLLALLPAVPGRTRTVARALADQESPSAVDALLRLPPDLPGVTEGVHRAVSLGWRRHYPAREAPRLLAIDFRASRARAFPSLLDRALARFGPRLERLELGRHRCYRFVVLPGEARVPELEAEVSWLHERLARQAGTRLWLNGWVLRRGEPFSIRTLGLLVHAWFDGARRFA